MSECPHTSPTRVSLRVFGLWSLPLVLLIGIILMGYQVWRHSQTLPLPAAADIQRIDFGINLGYTSTKWYKLPLPTGRALVDVFRGSVVMPPKRDGSVVAEITPDEYSAHIVDKRAKEYCFSFRVYSNDVYVRGSWARYSLYVFPDSRIPQLRTIVQNVLSTNGIVGGRYSYLPGEDDRTHYSRICGLILSGNAPSQNTDSGDTNR